MLIWNKLLPSGALAGTLSFFIGGKVSGILEEELQTVKVFMDNSEMSSFVLDTREMDLSEARKVVEAFRENIMAIRKGRGNVFAAVIHSFNRSYSWLENPQLEIANLYFIQHIDVEDCLGIPVNELWLKIPAGRSIPDDIVVKSPAVFLDPENPADVKKQLMGGIRYLTKPQKDIVQFVWPEKGSGYFKPKIDLEEPPLEDDRKELDRAALRRLEREARRGKI